RNGALALDDLTAGVRCLASELGLEIERQLALGGFAGIDEPAKLGDIAVQLSNAHLDVLFYWRHQGQNVERLERAPEAKRGEADGYDHPEGEAEEQHRVRNH